MPTASGSSPLNHVLQKSLDWIAANDTSEVTSQTSFFKTRGGVGKSNASGSGSLGFSSSKDLAKDASGAKTSTGRLVSNGKLADVETGRGNSASVSRATLGMAGSRATLGSAEYNDNDDDDDYSEISDYEFYSNPVSEDDYDGEDEDRNKLPASDTNAKKQEGWFPDGQVRL